MKGPRGVLPVLIAIMLLVMAVGCTESDDDGGSNLPTWKVGQGWLYSMTDTYTWETSGGDSYEEVKTCSLEVRVCGINVINGTPCYSVEEHLRKNGIAKGRDWYAVQVSSLNRMVGWDTQGPLKFPLGVGDSWHWTLDRHDYTVDMTSNCTEKESVESAAGKFDCYLVSYHGTHSEQEGDDRWRRTFHGDLFFSTSVENVVISTEFEVYEHWSGDYYQKSVYSESRHLEVYGSRDSDEDGVCNRIEEWAGMDPKAVDTDEDNVADNEDCSPTMDIGIRLDLERFTSDQDTDTSEGINGYECDPYLVLEIYDLDLEETLGPYSDQNTVDLGYSDTFDLNEFTTSVYFTVSVWDDDSGELADIDGDDRIDINPSGYEEVGTITFDLLECRWYCYPDEGEGGTEGSISGGADGNNEFDGSLDFVVMGVDMGGGT